MKDFKHVALQEFSVDMKAKLEARDSKYPNGWASDSDIHLIRRLLEEVSELVKAIETFSNVVEEAADVANVAMMLADNHKRKRAEHAQRCQDQGAADPDADVSFTG